MSRSQYYYNLDAATHQQKFNQLSADGYRMIDVCVSGTPPGYGMQLPGSRAAPDQQDGRHAMVWIEQHTNKLQVNMPRKNLRQPVFL